VTAAAVVIRFWDQCEHIKTSVWTTVFVSYGHWSPVARLTMSKLGLAVFINLFPSRVYGQMEFIFSTIKITTIVFLS
jgi:amino acid transporter